MPSTYTTNNGIELISTGEQSGAWGDTTNTNLGLLDTSLDGHTTITLVTPGTSGSPNALPITDGATSNGRNRALVFTDGGDLGASVYVQLTPNNAKKIMFVRNSLSGSRNLILFQGTYSGSNDFVLPAGKDAIVKFDGAGAGAVVSTVLEDFALNAATIASVDINGGTIDGAVIGGSTPAAVTTSSLVATTADINGGTIDGVTITGGSITGITDIAVLDGGTGASDASGARTNLGVAIGSDVQAYDAGLQSIAALTTAADRMIYTTASDTYAVATLTTAGRAILDDADASAQCTTLGVAIGSNVQAYDAGLQSISALTTAADRMIYTTASDTYAVATLSAAGRALIDDADNTAQRNTLGLGATDSPTFDTVNATTLLGDGSGITGIIAGMTFVTKTANYTAAHLEGVVADTSGGTFTVTLPATPSTGDYVSVVDGGDWATTNLTVGRNGSTIEGDAANMTMDIGGAFVTFVYDGTTWQVYATVGSNAATQYATFAQGALADTALQLPDLGTTEGVTAAASGVNVLSFAEASYSNTNNNYSTRTTFVTPPAGLWRFSLAAGVAGSVAGKIALEINATDYNVGTFDVYNPALFREFVIELDGTDDVIFKVGRSASSGSVSLRDMRVYGYKLR